MLFRTMQCMVVSCVYFIPPPRTPHSPSSRDASDVLQKMLFISIRKGTTRFPTGHAPRPHSGLLLRYLGATMCQEHKLDMCVSFAAITPCSSPWLPTAAALAPVASRGAPPGVPPQQG